MNTPNMYSIRPSPGKGLGVFANEIITAGTRILAEEPLVSIVDCPRDEGVEQRMIAALGRLSKEDLQKFGELHWPRHIGWDPRASRYIGNSFVLGAGTSAVFLTASRINHSCCANALFSWNSNLRRLTVHAMVDIPQGDEVTVGYIEHSYLPLASRQQRLHDAYGFMCECSACRREAESDQGAGPSSSEDLRQQMEKLAEPMEDYRLGRRHDPDDELASIISFLTLAEEAGLEGHFLSGMYGRASRLYHTRGSLGPAMEYAQVELERATLLLGLDNPLTKEAARAVEDLKSKEANKEQAK